MRKNKMTVIAIAFVLAVTAMGCAKTKEYSGEYDYETDAQYSYDTDIDSWKKYQSDGSGQYILMNNYIYYYNNETKQLNPLCDKANCLHDMETDSTKREECNAYIDKTSWNEETSVDPGYKFIQYYEGSIYYTIGPSVYCVSGDGAKKKKVFTTEGRNGAIISWLIHRGKLYYEVPEYSYEGDSVCARGVLRQIDIRDSMKEKDAKVIFQTDKELNMHDFGKISAYKNYLFFSTNCFSRDFQMTDNESWIRAAVYQFYMYDTDTEQVSAMELPDYQSDTEGISSVTFLKDKMLIKKYDDMQDCEYKSAIYSMDYDTKEITVWMEGIPQGCDMTAYKDHVIINNADIQYFKYDNQNSCNVEIYDSDAKKLSEFEYGINSIGTFSGFGPDGISVDVTQDDTSWYVHEISIEDVINCNGEKVTPKIVSERNFGELNNIDW